MLLQRSASDKGRLFSQEAYTGNKEVHVWLHTSNPGQTTVGSGALPDEPVPDWTRFAVRAAKKVGIAALLFTAVGVASVVLQRGSPDNANTEQP